MPFSSGRGGWARVCADRPRGRSRGPRRPGGNEHGERIGASGVTGILAAGLGTDVFRGFLQGLPPGTVYALIALGFVLTYKTSGVFNLAFGAQAYMSAVVYFKAHTEWGWPIVPSVLLSVVILAPLVGFVLEALIFRH